MMKMLASLAAVTFAASTASAATTYSGTFTPSGPGHHELAELALFGEGRYALAFDLSRTGEGWFTASMFTLVEYRDSETGDLMEWQDHPVEATLAFHPPSTRGRLRFKVPPNYVRDDGSVREEGFFFDDKVTLVAAFADTAPVDWSITIDRLASGGVPEPDAWALMVLGFGALGLAVRRRRVPVAAPASFGQVPRAITLKSLRGITI